MPYAKRDGLSLYYEQAGGGDPPLVFIHGWCCDHTFFQPQFDHFKAAHAVMARDLRGFGHSDQPEQGYDIPRLADDVAALCADVGLSSPVVVGHSLGGMIAIELAARYPDLPGAIVAMDPAQINPTPDVRHGFEGLLNQLEGPDGEAVRRTFVASLFLATDDVERRRRTIETMCSVPQRIAVAAMRGLVAWDGCGALLRCQAPLLVLFSRTGGPTDPARLLALKPDAHIGVTVGSGHFHQLEVPEQVIPMIDRFMQIAIKESSER